MTIKLFVPLEIHLLPLMRILMCILVFMELIIPEYKMGI